MEDSNDNGREIERELPLFVEMESQMLQNEVLLLNQKIKKRTKRKAQTALLLATCFTLFFMLVEIAGGWYAGSLAIMTDAAHLVCNLDLL